MKRIAVAAALVLLPAAALFAQTKAKPTEVAVSQIHDRRTSGSFSHLMITLDLPQIASKDVAASRVLVTSAVDDQGTSLLDGESGEPQLEINHRNAMPVEPGQTPPMTTVTMMLKNPARTAVAVKELKGEIELFMPSKDPNSVAEMAKFLSGAGKPVAHKALKANGVEITILTAAQLDAERKRLGDAKRKEMKEMGFEGDDLESYVNSFLEGVLRVEESDLAVRLKDPNKRIQDISYVTANGETKQISTRDDEGLTIFTTWGDKPLPDWKLRVNMKTNKNLVRHPFTLTNVALP